MLGLPDCLDRCAHDGSAAVAVYVVPPGCIGLRDYVLQPLCAQHEYSLPDGAYGDDWWVVADLVPGWPSERWVYNAEGTERL